MATVNDPIRYSEIAIVYTVEYLLCSTVLCIWSSVHVCTAIPHWLNEMLFIAQMCVQQHMCNPR